MGGADGTTPAPEVAADPRPRRSRARPPSSPSASAKVQRLLNSLGVQAVVAGGQSMNPSTAQILEAVERCPADSVIVLPNNKNIVPVAEQVHALTTRRVEVVPTQAIVEALALSCTTRRPPSTPTRPR